MYLVALYVALDVDPELALADRQRLLRSLKEKLKQKFQHRMTVGVDDQEMAFCVSFFDENFERSKHKVDLILEGIEDSGEARIHFSQAQRYLWHEGRFVETNERELLDQEERGFHHPDNKKFSLSSHAKDRMIIYADAEEDEDTPALSSRFSRKNFRIPTRK